MIIILNVIVPYLQTLGR